MATRRYAAELRPGDRVDDTYVLRGKEMRAARTGEAYLALELTDRSGRIAGIMFRPDRAAQDVPVDTVVRVSGAVTSYRGTDRISVTSLRPSEHYEATDIMAVSSRDVREMVDELRTLTRPVEDPALAALLRSVFGDRAFFARFKVSPAAHHACVGGLLEHTVAVAAICTHLADAYPLAARDLLVSAALLHDVGVVEQLRGGIGVDLTDEGRLLGHVMLGERRIRAVCERVDPQLSPETMLCLTHAIAAHHQDGGGASVPAPATLEALLLHRADEIDITATGFAESLRPAGLVQEPWTGTDNPFGRPLRAPRETAAGGGPKPRRVLHAMSA